MNLSAQATQEVMAATKKIAERAGVRPYQVALSVEPLDEDPGKPYWIVTIVEEGHTFVEGHANLEDAVNVIVPQVRSRKETA